MYLKIVTIFSFYVTVKFEKVLLKRNKFVENIRTILFFDISIRDAPITISKLVAYKNTKK